MDATILAVVGTGVALFGALWKVQGHRFDMIEKRFEMAEKANDERFKMAEKLNRERFEALEKRNAAEHATICQSISKLDDRTAALEQRVDALDGRVDALDRRVDGLDRRFDVLDRRFDTLDGRFDALYRHLLDAPPRTARPGDPADKQESAP